LLTSEIPIRGSPGFVPSGRREMTGLANGLRKPNISLREKGLDRNDTRLPKRAREAKNMNRIRTGILLAGLTALFMAIGFSPWGHSGGSSRGPWG
jgi:hypothetical protein